MFCMGGLELNRGNKLWHGSRIILPEHRAAMLEHRRLKECFVEKPILDEDKLKEMSQVIGEAMRQKSLVTVTIYEPYRSQQITMLPKYFDEVVRCLRGVSQLGE